MTIQITQTTPQPPLQVDSSAIVTFRGWYTTSFVASDGVTPIESGNGQTGFYYEYLCTINDDGFVVIPAIDIQPTTGSNPTAGFFGAVFVNGAFERMIFGYPQATAGWQIPTIYGDVINFGQLALYNAAVQLLLPPNTYPTFDQVVRLIQTLAGNQQYAGLGVNGITALSVAPASANQPIAFGVNDPTVLTGSLGAGVVPRASGVNTVVPSQITDNGINVSIQTLNTFQAGDFNFVQNGSRVDVNDNTGRAELFAGGNGQAEYAGVVGSCVGTNPGEVFVQATDYSYLYGTAGVVLLGDGQLANNGTVITIDDLNSVIKLSNLPTSDPAIVDALWRSGSTLMISNG